MEKKEFNLTDEQQRKVDRKAKIIMAMIVFIMTIGTVITVGAISYGLWYLATTIFNYWF